MNKKWLFAIPAVALIIACGGNTEGSEDDVNRLNDQANGNAPVATKSAPKVVNITEGDWEIGTKDNYAGNVLTPGTYVVTAPENSDFGCMWSTVKDFSGEMGTIINIDTVEPGTSGRMVVKKSYGGVSLSGDCLVKKKGK